MNYILFGLGLGYFYCLENCWIVLLWCFDYDLIVEIKGYWFFFWWSKYSCIKVDFFLIFIEDVEIWVVFVVVLESIVLC